MSCQTTQWARRNVSPAMQGPLKATVPVSLMRQNPCSPTKNKNKRGSPSKSPNSIVCNDVLKSKRKSSDDKRTVRSESRVEKSKTLNLRSQPQEHVIRRTASLDAIYIASQWLPNTIFLGYCGHLMIDRTTQTPEEWNEVNKKSHRKPPVASGDHLEVKYIKQKLQRTNQISRGTGGILSSQRHSPIQGNHFAISTSRNVLFNTLKSTSSVGNPLSISGNSSHCGVTIGGNVRSGAVPLTNCPKPRLNRTHNSLESLNQEIENLVLKECFETDKEKEAHMRRITLPTPEGHHAPIADLFHSAQRENIHSLSARKDTYSSNGTSNHGYSISPAVSVIPGNSDFSTSPISDDVENLNKLRSSPHINQFVFRGPPDGCEKVKMFDEPRKPLDFDELSNSNTLKPRVTCVLLPSQSSAFCPLYKEMKTPTMQPLDSFALISTQSSKGIFH